MKKQFTTKDLRDFVICLDYGTLMASIILHHMNINPIFNEHHLLLIVSGTLLLSLIVFWLFDKRFVVTEQDNVNYAESVAMTACLFASSLFSVLNLSILVIAIEAIIFGGINAVIYWETDSKLFYFLTIKFGYGFIWTSVMMFCYSEVGLSIFAIVPLLHILFVVCAKKAEKHFLAKQAAFIYDRGRYEMYGLLVDLMKVFQEACGMMADSLRCLLPVSKK